MRVYVDTSFLKQIVYRQADSKASVQILAAAERGHLSLKVPAVSVLEVSRAVTAGDPDRRALLNRAGVELRQAQRSDAPLLSLVEAQVAALKATLEQWGARERVRFKRLRDRLTAGGFMLPLTDAAFAVAVALELPPEDARDRKRGYGPDDAAVFATVITDLAERPVAAGQEAVFLTDDRRFREHPQIVQEAKRAGLTLGRKPADVLRRALAADQASPPHTS